MEGPLTATSLLLSALLLQSAASTPQYCGVPLKDRRITGGVPAEEFQFPWQVPLFLNYGWYDRFICTGTLISTQSVLTAGHCVLDTSDILVGIPNGTVSRDDLIKIPSGSITRHPYYDEFRGLDSPINDFAVITLSEPVEFGEGIIPICLADPNANYEYKEVTVAGYGRDETGNLPSELLTTNMTTMDNEECSELLIGAWHVKSSMLCAKSEVSNTCPGDSGGSLIVLEGDGAFYSQIGVTSWGYSSCGFDLPAVFGRVTNQLYWILQQIKGDTLPAPVPRPTSYSGSGEL